MEAPQPRLRYPSPIPYSYRNLDHIVTIILRPEARYQSGQSAPRRQQRNGAMAQPTRAARQHADPKARTKREQNEEPEPGDSPEAPTEPTARAREARSERHAGEGAASGVRTQGKEDEKTKANKAKVPYGWRRGERGGDGAASLEVGNLAYGRGRRRPYTPPPNHRARGKGTTNAGSTGSGRRVL